VTGAVTKNTIGSGPNSSIQENLTNSLGNVSGSVTTNSVRSFRVAGYVNTSHGRVGTDIRQQVNFSNLQNFNITATAYTQDITQNTQLTSTVVTSNGEGPGAARESFTYPLTLNYTLIFNADGSITQNGQVSQEFDHDFVSPRLTSLVRNKVKSADTLDLNSSFQITGNSGQQSSQSYDVVDSLGGRYNCTLKARNNALTFASEDCGRLDH
jgi:hypothetical protein